MTVEEQGRKESGSTNKITIDICRKDKFCLSRDITNKVYRRNVVTAESSLQNNSVVLLSYGMMN